MVRVTATTATATAMATATATVSVFAGICFLAACLALAKNLRGFERFDMLNDIGIDMVEGVCSVVGANRGVYNLSRVDALRRHPNVTDACFFVSRDEHGIMRPDLSDCQPKSAVDNSTVVRSIGMEPVLGLQECVLRFNGDLPAEEYSKYETQLVELGVARSRLYRTTESQFIEATNIINKLKQQTAKAERELQKQIEAYNRAYALMTQASAEMEALTAAAAKRKQQLAQLRRIIDNDASEASRLEQEIAAKEKDYQSTLSKISALQKSMNEVNGQMDAMQRAIDAKKISIADLRNKLKVATDDAEAKRAAALQAVARETQRAAQCNA